MSWVLVLQIVVLVTWAALMVIAIKGANRGDFKPPLKQTTTESVGDGGSRVTTVEWGP